MSHEKRGPKGPRGSTRELILKVAVQVLPSGGKMIEVARVAGVHRTLVQHYYKTLDDLRAAIGMRRCKRCCGSGWVLVPVRAAGEEEE